MQLRNITFQLNVRIRALSECANYLYYWLVGWKLVFKVAEGQSLGSASDLYTLWTGTFTMNEGDSSAVSFNAGTKTLKSSIIDKWDQYYISAVRLTLSSIL